jgi:hypothetical protein
MGTSHDALGYSYFFTSSVVFSSPGDGLTANTKMGCQVDTSDPSHTNHKTDNQAPATRR